MFSESQLQDLRDLQEAARDLGAEAVIIGAMAYRLLIADENRETYDIDLAIALDLDGFRRLAETMTRLGWNPERAQEQRWRTSRGNRFDLLPAGSSLRRQGKMIWPQTGFVMSLAGFDHVFENAVLRELGNGLTYKVVPPPVLALLKMVAYLDDPHRRMKDLLDLGNIMRQYERDTERIFSDSVFEANLSDIEFAGAFLLGMDLGIISADKDVSIVSSFLDRLAKVQKDTIESDDRRTAALRHFHKQLSVFAKGFKAARQ